MSDLVDPGTIEKIVGARRHQSEHLGRAVSAEGKVYVLHSRDCVGSNIDLRECPFSVALDKGIEAPAVWSAWERAQDVTVYLRTVGGGFLYPFVIGERIAWIGGFELLPKVHDVPAHIEDAAASLERCGPIYAWLAAWVRHDNEEENHAVQD